MAADDFGRADENPLAGEWSTVSGLAAIALVSGAIRAAASGNDSAARFNSSSEMSSRVKISTVGDSDGGPALWAAGTANGYFVVAGNGVEIFLYRDDGGTPTELQHVTGTYSLGSQIRIRRSGGNVIISKDAVDILTHADSTYLTGNPGVFCFGTVELDEFTDDVPTAGIPVPPTRIGVKFARPGRGPPSKGKFKVERIDSFEQNFFVESIAPITFEEDDTGTSRPRPGRGPFSLGRFFVGNIDVYSDVSGGGPQVLNADAIGIGASFGQYLAASVLAAAGTGSGSGVGNGTGSLTAAASGAAVGASHGQSAARLLISAIAHACSETSPFWNGALLVSGIGQSNAAATAAVTASEIIAATAQGIGAGNGQYLASEILAWIAQACGVAQGVFSQQSGSIISAQAFGFAVGMAGAIGAQTMSAPASGIAAGAPRAVAVEVMAAIATAIADAAANGSGAETVAAMAQAAGIVAALVSSSGLNVVSGAAVGFGNTSGLCVPLVIISAPANSNAEVIAAAAASQISKGAALGIADSTGRPTAALVLGANARAVAESLGRALSQSTRQRIASTRVVYVSASNRVVVVPSPGSKLH